MFQRPPYHLCLLSEVLEKPDKSSVKFYAQMVGPSDGRWTPDAILWTVEDRGLKLVCDLSCGHGDNPCRGEWFRFMGFKDGEIVRVQFLPKMMRDFDIIIFEQSLKVRRHHQDSFEAEILRYAAPDNIQL